MTVHAVWIKCSTQQASNPDTVPSPEPPDLVDVLPDRVSQNVMDTLTEKLPGQAQSPAVRNTEKDGSGTDYIQAVYRVSEADSKSKVLDKFENGAVADADWYKIEWHVCDHDGNPTIGTGCGYTDSDGSKVFGWQTEREHGNVPSEV